ncbi:hypothetical protein KUL25_12730 [Rhodobacteraceae bacterium N5(2021)]|uniref:Uncharacterized protein n=1 Tax=Gymnodinialimonas phycosphaerae TaxID=2841589 RepID=A0A975TRE8_9RHOB|nr:hypothetical protein [Gymnodinialimonas phycosphaerae]MBY4893628.1 hypothetical protein [Gymnodinialimonas phycosphaerae]
MYGPGRSEQIGIGMMSELRVWLDEVPGTLRPQFLPGGFSIDDLPFEPTDHFGSHLEPHGFIAPPARNPLLTRDTFSWLFAGLSVNPTLDHRLTRNLVNIVATRLTQVIVGAGDFAFGKPTKFVGSNHGKAYAEQHAKAGNWAIVKDGGDITVMRRPDDSLTGADALARLEGKAGTRITLQAKGDST